MNAVDRTLCEGYILFFVLPLIMLSIVTGHFKELLVIFAGFSVGSLYAYAFLKFLNWRYNKLVGGHD